MVENVPDTSLLSRLVSAVSDKEFSVMLTQCPHSLHSKMVGRLLWLHLYRYAPQSCSVSVVVARASLFNIE